MQSINVQAINPLFLVVFIGTGPFLVALAVAQTLAGESDALLWAAAVVYILGVIVVTTGGNVPLNDRLATVVATTAEAGTWRAYSSPWTMLNHLRTAAAASSSLILGYSLAR